MSDPLNDYNAMIESLKVKFENFINNSESGADGRGSNNFSLAARKLSSEISKDLKNYRSLSVINDKDKIKRKDDENSEVSNTPE